MIILTHYTQLAKEWIITMFSKKRNPLMRRFAIGSNNNINSLVDSIDRLNTTMVKMQEMIANNNFSTGIQSANAQSTNTQKERMYIPEPDIRSMETSNKTRGKQTIDSQGISETLKSLNNMEK